MEIWKLKPLREKFSLMNNVQMLVDWLNVTRICHGYLLNFAIQISVFCGNAGIADKLRCTSPIFFVRLKKSSPQDALLSHSDGSHSQKSRSNLGNILKDMNLVSQWAHLPCSTSCMHSGFLARMQICLEIDSCLCEWVHRWIWSPSLYVYLVSCVFILPVFPGMPSCIRTCIL